MHLNEINDDSVLDSVFEIEELLEAIAVYQNKISHYESLKKYRNSVLDDKIQKAQDNIKMYRKVILETMKEKAPDNKTLDFAPLGKVTRKKANDMWCVDDEETVLDFLAGKKLKDKVVELREKIVKKKLDELLNTLEKKGTTVPGVHIQHGEENISIVFDKAYKPAKEEVVVERVVELENIEI